MQGDQDGGVQAAGGRAATESEQTYWREHVCMLIHSERSTAGDRLWIIRVSEGYGAPVNV